jgi:hypothetical protein
MLLTEGGAVVPTALFGVSPKTLAMRHDTPTEPALIN